MHETQVRYGSHESIHIFRFGDKNFVRPQFVSQRTSKVTVLNCFVIYNKPKIS